MLLTAAAAGMLMVAGQTGGMEGAAPAPIGDAIPAGQAGATPASPPVTSAPPGNPGEVVTDIVVTGEPKPTPGDPLEKLNAQSFEAVQSVDKAVIEPVARAYKKGLPRPVRSGLRNFFSNLQEPVVAVAYLLQLKPGKAVETTGRFAVNSTLGLVGLFDVAKRKPFHLPYRPNGLANTLGYYGVKSGPYFYLPIVGPTTLRDIIGDTVDQMVVPFAVGSPFNKPTYVIPATILNQLGERAAFDDQIQMIRANDDPYVAYRTLYMTQRAAEIEALHHPKRGPDAAAPSIPVYGRSLGETPAAPVPEPADPQ